MPDHPVDAELSAFAVYSFAGILRMKLFQSMPEFLVTWVRMYFFRDKDKEFS